MSAIATSAVRDAENSSMFLAELRERFALDARIVDGAEEARLTYLGATAQRPPASKTLVVDIGGGSTELVIGDGDEVGFYASLQAGTVRHTERYVTHDPPEAAELEELANDVRQLIDESLEGSALAVANEGIGVAGTPTSLAAIEQRLDPYDPSWSTATGSRWSRFSGCARSSPRCRSRSASRSSGCTRAGRRR